MDGYKGTVRERGRKTQVLNQASQRVAASARLASQFAENPPLFSL